MNSVAIDESLIGKTIDELDTPFLAIDLDAFEHNIAQMAATCKGHDINWRPHCKCHKSGLIASRLVKAGALGVTCAKISEAEVVARHGVTDMLIANMIVGQPKIQRLVELRRIANPVVAVDHWDQARPLGEAMAAAGLAIRVIIEVDIGLNRVGTLPGEPTMELARKICAQPGLTFAGIMGYEGHLLALADQEEKVTAINDALDVLADTAQLLANEGIPCEIISCGGTGSYQISVKHSGITELQAGGGIFMDEFYLNDCQVEGHQYAMSIVATVVSRPAPDRAIMDAGRKTMSRENNPPRVVGRDDLSVAALSAEHGALELADGAELSIGDRLRIIPSYSDLTAVLHNAFLAFRGDKLVEIWPLEARGLLT